jgi:hypothetical protein
MRKWLRNIRRIRIRPVQAADLNERMVVVNLYITQSLLLFIGIMVILFQSRSLTDLLKISDASSLLWVLFFSGSAVLVNIALTPVVPKELNKPDELHVMLAKRLPLWHLALVCALIGFSEELLFRGAIQYVIGNYWASLLFAVLHAHYLRHWILTGLIFLLSYGLGWIYEQTGTLLVSAMAHALYDLIMFMIVRYNIGGYYGSHEDKTP